MGTNFMNLNIEIIIRQEGWSADEVAVIESFLKWQGAKYTVVVDGRRHAFLSRGRGGVVVHVGSHNIRVDGFPGLYNWFEQEGLFRL